MAELATTNTLATVESGDASSGVEVACEQESRRAESGDIGEGQAQGGDGGQPEEAGVEGAAVGLSGLGGQKETAELLARGLLDALGPCIQRVEQHLIDIESNQQGLIRGLQEQGGGLPELQELSELLAKVPQYTAKAGALRREMRGLSERVEKAKKRATKLRVRREAEVREAERRLAEAAHRDAMLVARSAEDVLGAADEL